MATRTTMEDLRRRLRIELDNTSTITEEQLQDLLDANRRAVDVPLLPRVPFYLEHTAAGVRDLEGGAIVYTGYDTQLTITTDYTIDLQTATVTTAAADRRPLRLQGWAYDLAGAAADGWERMANGVWDEFDLADNGSSLSRSQKLQHAQQRAAQYRRRAWAGSARTERTDSATGPGTADARAWADRYRINRGRP